MTQQTYAALTTEQLTDFCAQKHSEVTLRKKELEAAQKELYTRMQQNNLNEVKSVFGRFISYVRPTYQMPEDVIALKDQLKEAEGRAIAEGRATKVENTFYKFAPLKKEDEI